MAAKEFSPRCLRLTEHIISLNPAHYTVWLYRFSIISALHLSIPTEIEWVNKVALKYLKNYQIWHHRHQLLEAHFRSIAENPEELKAFAKSEQEFLEQMLEDDTKNYHVWSYRQFLVRKLALWDQDELEAVEKYITDDVRNNSAWSHRFFLVFSHPAASTPGSLSTEHDPKVPEEIVNRELAYAQEKILLAPQNQSPWNYLRGAMVKGGRKMSEVEEFADQFISCVGEEGEDVKSSHAMDMLAEIYAEQGKTEKADLYLQRLGDKWDRVREGYWAHRRTCLSEKPAA
jgi:protein farnesyltransferase/geranylgeranyltransferase type-1 subunit alpha